MNLLLLNWNIFLFFYDSFLGETPLNDHQKTIAAPRDIAITHYITKNV